MQVGREIVSEPAARLAQGQAGLNSAMVELISLRVKSLESGDLVHAQTPLYQRGLA